MEANNDLKIFLVDDDKFCLNIYQHHLEQWGYKNVTCFESGKACLERLGERPDVIFLDHEINNEDGLEILKKIKKADRGIAVVLLSGKASLQAAIKILNTGAMDYIVKGLYDTESIEKILKKIQIDALYNRLIS